MFNFLRPAAPTMTAAEAVTRAKAGQITVIDVREAKEIAASGKAKGALHNPLALVPIKANPRQRIAPRDWTLAPLLRSIAPRGCGRRASVTAVTALRKLGYQAHNIGTIRDRVAAGGAVSRRNGSIVRFM